MLSFKGYVAVVTGAGGGLGRIYSLELAKRGALVVVNDLGGLRDGKGQNTSAANLVVEEIKTLGGQAVANYDSVENGANIINTAIGNFGKIDILINNAGILRDKSFGRMGKEDWQRVIDIHLNGAYSTTKSAWEYMKNQNFGRIIFTTSASGLYGNFGQANYSAAKSALVGLCKTLSVEGRKYDIRCNAIAPIAGSRMTEDVFPPDLFESLRPEHIAPLVLYLSHPSCNETGSVFEAGGGWIGKVRLEVSKGQNLLAGAQQQFFLPDDVSENWENICRFDESESSNKHPVTIKDSMANVMQNIIPKEPPLKTAFNSLSDIIGFKLSRELEPYCFKDFVLYGLSVGLDKPSKETIKFLYENHADFCCLPTFSVIPMLDVAMEALKIVDKDLEINMINLLHGEQYLEVHRPIPMGEKINACAEFVDVVNKVRGTVIATKVTLHDKNNVLLADSQIIVFISGLEYPDGKRKSDVIIETRPVPNKRPADKTVERFILPNQSALYRLNGDFNPIHIDPELADSIGFDGPILHGLCVFGIIGYDVLAQFLQYDTDRFKKIKLRFSSPILPGQTIVTEFWKESNGIIHFQTKNKETGKVCVSGGFVETADHSEVKVNAKL